MNKFYFMLMFFAYFQLNIAKGQINTYSICNSEYQHLIANYNDHLLNYTILFSGPRNLEFFINGFHDFIDQDSLVFYFTNGHNCKEHFIKGPRIDTINTINWFNGYLPHTKHDSVILHRKIEYAYILYKFNENRLNEDSNVKIRLLFPEDMIDGQGKWLMYKVIFNEESTIIMAQESDIVDNIGRRTIYSESNKIKPRMKDSFYKNLETLKLSDGYECFQDDYYPCLLEYFDGRVERCYIFSNRCNEEKIIKKQYEELIRKILVCTIKVL